MQNFTALCLDIAPSADNIQLLKFENICTQLRGHDHPPGDKEHVRSVVRSPWHILDTQHMKKLKLEMFVALQFCPGRTQNSSDYIMCLNKRYGHTGHRSRVTTLSVITKDFWWENSNEEVPEFVHSWKHSVVSRAEESSSPTGRCLTRSKS